MKEIKKTRIGFEEASADKQKSDEKDTALKKFKCPKNEFKPKDISDEDLKIAVWALVNR